jgi:hypothetical protein
MADGTVGVAQSPQPDRLVDNETVTTGAGGVYRQRVRIGGGAGGDLADVVAGALKVKIVNPGRFVFTQVAPATVWGPIVHNLAGNPSIQIVDTAGTLHPIFAANFSDPNTVTVTFAAPLSGTATLVLPAA